MQQSKGRSAIKKIMQHEQTALTLALVAVCVVLSFLTNKFFSVLNITNILRQTSLIAIAGIGMTMIILSGEIDLSVGSLQALAGCAAVSVLNATNNILLALIVALAVGLVTGLINGLLVTRAGLNSMIATLATMAIFRGIVMVATNAVSIPVRVESFSNIGAGYVGAIPVPVIIAVVLLAIFYFIINHTVFGRYIYAVGGNAEAAQLAGLSVKNIKLAVYMIGHLLFALSAFILASRLNAGQAIAGDGFEMQVIAAVILGGVSMSGGSGSLMGAVIGMLILGVVQNGLVLLDVNTFYHEIVRGGIILLAVYLDVRRKKKLSAQLVRAGNEENGKAGMTAVEEGVA